MRPNTPVKVYVAAPWIHKQDAITAGERLRAAGFEVTSRWFYHDGNPNDSAGLTEALEHIQFQAREDIDDVMRSEALVVLNLAKSEGKAVETGIALANAIPVISVGPRSNIFQTLGIEVATLDEAIDVVRQLYPRIPIYTCAS